MRRIIPILLVCLVHLHSSSAFYVSFAHKSYKDGDEIPLYVNKIFSDKTQLPLAYSELPFVCSPANGWKRKLLNLGEVLSGDRISNSDFKILTNENVACKVLCTRVIRKDDIDLAKELINNYYLVEWILDDLPGATKVIDSNNKKSYDVGFPVGFRDEKTGRTELNTHFDFKIMYEKKKSNDKLIVGFEVQPRSIRLSDKKCPADVNTIKEPLELDHGENVMDITYSYSVTWQEDKEVRWGDRWSLYMSANDPQIHWYSIINSIIILLFLTAMVAIILLRTLNRDIAIYNNEDLKEEPEDTTGWKLLHGDVFRPPRLAGLLAPLLGTGMQLLLAMSSAVGLSMLGILNPAFRGGLVSFALFSFTFMGIFAGYFSARMYKAFKGTAWQRNALLTALLCPSAVFTIVLFVNFFIWSKHASTAIPFGTFFALASMWFGISLPLVYIGAYFGNRKQAIEHPVRTNQIPRQIPDQVWYLQPFASIMVAGLIPFAVVFLELFFILKSVWQAEQFYYMFGFLGVVFVLLVFTCIEITIVYVYFQLSSEDYTWHWRAYLVSSASALYIFLYSCYYYYSKLDITDFVSALVYFAYSLVVCFGYWLATGTIGFITTYSFVREMYSSIKID
ncbi:hypothetical protein SeMB42_g06041 [Synchytrium endobioticum]|uniref:Transmembrane 9 superfamily member n=1 Tax=Synchytrium endobioticum TaxID=286115 RepID=A0A507CZ60_9FUNG|nr:hypothetical protein SeMB42_g06041 [Synchytrium endobioticum]TPX44200.1 hypothetical protein SeLEV6574_g04642 [Synchytrium endobioticum]